LLPVRAAPSRSMTKRIPSSAREEADIRMTGDWERSRSRMASAVGKQYRI
jgi:hypothetical protein